MRSLNLTQILAFLSLGFFILAFGARLRAFSRLSRPADRATPRGKAAAGVLYAYTLGMAPWAKESTRIHWLAYLRGVAFHLGIFLGLAILVASPWISALSHPWRIFLAVGSGAGCLFGLIGFAARFLEPNLKSLSTPDDYSAVLLVSLFLGVQCFWLLGVFPAGLFFLVSAIMLVYAPFSKIRHCFYYAFSRMFFGKFMGSHGVLPHSQQSILLSREVTDDQP